MPRTDWLDMGWGQLDLDATLLVGDVLASAGVCPDFVLMSGNKGSGHRDWVSTEGFVRGVGFCVYRLRNRVVRDQTTDMVNGFVLRAYRRLVPITYDELQDIERGNQRRGYFREAPDEVAGLNVPPWARRKTMLVPNPIYSKPHPFFLREVEEAKAPKEIALSGELEKLLDDWDFGDQLPDRPF